LPHRKNAVPAATICQSGVTGRALGSEAVLTAAPAAGDAAVGQDHPPGRLVAGGAGKQDPVQAQPPAFGQPGREHPGGVALPPPRRHD
jgi:hypothetical protein